MKEKVKKRGPGQPTKYRKQYCDEIVEFLMSGASILEFAVNIGVCHDTICEWAKVHPEFSEAKKKAIKASEAWWTRKGRVELENTKFNSTLWYMNMKNRFGWRDKQEVKHDGTVTVSLTTYLSSK